MNIQLLIRQIIREAYGDMEFGTGTKTEEAHKLIAYGETDSESHNYAINVRNDGKLMYDFLKKKYEKKVGPLFHGHSDEETVFYDFMDNYKDSHILLNDDDARDIAISAFGKHVDNEVKVIRFHKGGTLVQVADDNFDNLVKMAKLRGYRVVPDKKNSAHAHVIKVMEIQNETGKFFLWITNEPEKPSLQGYDFGS